MNIQEEKAYIYEMMKEVTQERRRLTDIYYGLKERLDFLFLQEQKGLNDLSLKGYTDLYTQTQKEIAATNIQREATYAIKQLELPIEKKEEILPKIEVEKEKEIIGIENRKRKGKLNIDKVTMLIVKVLKEHGAPMKKESLYEKVQGLSDLEITKQNFSNNLLRKAIDKNNKIENIMKGFYQYRG